MYTDLQSALVSFRDTDDGDFCFDTSVGTGRREYPVVYVDHWSNGPTPAADPFARSFLDWLTQTLEHDINTRRAALDHWARRLKGT